MAYATDKTYKRRHLYVSEKNSRLLDIEAAKKGTDVSRILNSALTLYFSKLKG